jgi:hypothetical protein
MSQGWGMLQRWWGGGWRLSLGNHRTKRRREWRILRNREAESSLVPCYMYASFFKTNAGVLQGTDTTRYERYGGVQACPDEATTFRYQHRRAWTPSHQLDCAWQQKAVRSAVHLYTCITWLLIISSQKSRENPPRFQKFTQHSDFLS